MLLAIFIMSTVVLADNSRKKSDTSIIGYKTYTYIGDIGVSSGYVFGGQVTIMGTNQAQIDALITKAKKVVNGRERVSPLIRLA